MQKLLNFNKVRFEGNIDKSVIKSIRKKDIAIIGLSAKLGGTADADDLWSRLLCGEDTVRPFPEKRKQDAENYLKAIEENPGAIEFHDGAFMEEIDKFDYKFFQISRKEADLMDPNQRLFLEAAWKAIADAGYREKALAGKRVGVFVGYSADFGEEYKRMVRVMEPDAVKISTTGNIKSIIAGRISYLLDLHGPSMVIDTACSSSLVALHEACRSLREGACEAAVAGGVKVYLLPVKAESNARVGIAILNDITSSDGRTKTFDDSSDGTLLGEGAAAILLKPLYRAMADGDHIYAVIKGSAVNQDGSSNGITAPNSAAQEDVICDAWRDAEIDPETISYIEAHGTGTKLGDSVEISGLERAFQNYTDKKQFCAIGSVKTNMGHLDSAAGISGFMKAVLSIYNRKLPPSLNFSYPNRNIPLIRSPVFIQDCLADWDTKGIPRRCGVSSFGLSGTNCHIVLEEAPLSIKEQTGTQQEWHIFTLSAKSESSFKEMVKSYNSYFSSDDLPSIENICYTANNGREHYQYRLAILVKSTEDLECKLAQLLAYHYQYEKVRDVYFGVCKVIHHEKEVKEYGELTELEKRKLSQKGNALLKSGATELISGDSYRRLCELYAQGADLEWSYLYRTGIYVRVSLPTYMFERSRCWVKAGRKHVISPLIDACIVKTMNLEIYKTQFQVDKHWVLNEHKVLDKYVVPGTAYIEMVRSVLEKENNSPCLVISDLRFLAPLALDKKESKETHFMIQYLDTQINFCIISKDGASNEWITHVSGQVTYEANEREDSFHFDAIRAGFTSAKKLVYPHSTQNPVRIGPRWDTYDGIYQKDHEYFSHIRLQQSYHQDLQEYKLHPAMMDCGLNTANAFIGDGLYLPFSYKKLKIYGAAPSSFYCYLKRRIKHDNNETASFDVYLSDEEGKVFMKAEEYIIKKVRMKTPNAYHQVGWVKEEAVTQSAYIKAKRILLFRNSAAIEEEVIKELALMGNEIIEVLPGSTFRKISAQKYELGNSPMDYRRLIKEQSNDLSVIIHMSSVGGAASVNTTDELEDELKHGVYSLFYLTKELAFQRLEEKIQLFVVSEYAAMVTNSQNRINPLNAALFGLAKVIEKEYAKLLCRTIDIDRTTSGKELVEELLIKEAPFAVAIRKKSRYVEEFKSAALEEAIDTEMPKAGGAYVITGGTGGLGLMLAQYLAARKQVKLALLSRSGFTAGEKQEHVGGAIKAMEAMGAKVECYAVDVSDYQGMRAVLTDFRSKHGRIQGIFHCAGVAGDGFLFRKEETAFKNVIEPKVKGTWILERLTKEDTLDFFVMFSSIATVMHLAGQGDYTAANSFMDSFAHSMNAQGRKAVSIKWAPWKETGMAVDYQVQMEKGVFQPVSNEEGLAALEMILAAQKTGVIVGRINEECWDQILELYRIPDSVSCTALKKKSLQSADEKKGRPAERNNDVVIMGKQQQSLSQTEIKVATIWANFLSLEAIDIYESFYTMGGDSLMATMLVAELDKAYPNTLDVTDLFTYSSVVELSKYIEQKTKKTEETEAKAELTLTWIVDQLSKNKISPEKADQLIKSIS